MGHLGYFLVLWVPPCPWTTIISTKDLSLYIHIPNIFLRLGFEFGLQRIRDLALVCPLFCEIPKVIYLKYNYKHSNESCTFAVLEPFGRNENFCNFAKASYFWGFFHIFMGQNKYKIRISVSVIKKNVNFGYKVYFLRSKSNTQSIVCARIYTIKLRVSPRVHNKKIVFFPKEHQISPSYAIWKNLDVLLNKKC